MMQGVESDIGLKYGAKYTFSGSFDGDLVYCGLDSTGQEKTACFTQPLNKECADPVIEREVPETDLETDGDYIVVSGRAILGARFYWQGEVGNYEAFLDEKGELVVDPNGRQLGGDKFHRLSGLCEKGGLLAA